MKKNLIIWAMIAVFIFSASGCATIFYPDRQGPNRGGQVDILMLCVDLVVFWPGLIIDFMTGAIYLPYGSSGVGNPNNVVPHNDGDIIGGLYQNIQTGEIRYIVPQKIDRSKFVQHCEYTIVEGAKGELAFAK
jgi:hypothetical protein